MTQREAFEAWARVSHVNRNVFTDDQDLTIALPMSWSAWQAAQAQAAESTMQEVATDGALVEVRRTNYRTPPQHQAEISAPHAEIDDCHKRMRLALEALRELADCGAEAWSAERPCVKDGYAVIAALEKIL